MSPRARRGRAARAAAAAAAARNERRVVRVGPGIERADLRPKSAQAPAESRPRRPGWRALHPLLHCARMSRRARGGRARIERPRALPAGRDRDGGARGVALPPGVKRVGPEERSRPRHARPRRRRRPGSARRDASGSAGSPSARRSRSSAIVLLTLAGRFPRGLAVAGGAVLGALAAVAFRAPLATHVGVSLVVAAPVLATVAAAACAFVPLAFPVAVGALPGLLLGLEVPLAGRAAIGGAVGALVAGGVALLFARVVAIGSVSRAGRPARRNRCGRDRRRPAAGARALGPPTRDPRARARARDRRRRLPARPRRRSDARADAAPRPSPSARHWWTSSFRPQGSGHVNTASFPRPEVRGLRSTPLTDWH